MKLFITYLQSELKLMSRGGSCNSIDDPYAWVYNSNNIKTMNLKLLNLMSGVNETWFSVKYESCKCNCKLNESAWNSKQKWNHDGCCCECKELDDSSSCKDNYMWNLCWCDCECNEAFKTCSCKKRLLGKLVITFEDEILNKNETSLNDKKVTCEKIASFVIGWYFYQLLLLLYKTWMKTEAFITTSRRQR